MLVSLLWNQCAHDHSKSGGTPSFLAEDAHIPRALNCNSHLDRKDRHVSLSGLPASSLWHAAEHEDVMPMSRPLHGRSKDCLHHRSPR
jgi:hypothetical protein